MKKLSSFAIAFALLAFIGTSAGAQICVTFDNFVDALEINVTDGGTILDYNTLTGHWHNWDGAGSNENAAGSFHRGLATFCAGDIFDGGNPFCFVVDPNGGPDGACAFDLYQHDGCIPGETTCGSVLFQHLSPCTVVDGHCPTGLVGGPVSLDGLN